MTAAPARVRAARASVRQVGVTVLVCALLALVWLPDAYLLYQATLWMAAVIALIGMVLLTGIAGQISLGQGAFVALGAYVGGMLLQHAAALPGALGVALAGAVGFLAGGLLGYTALRWSGHLLARASFALAIAVPQLLKLPLLAGLTGGSQGLVIDRAPPPAWLETVGIAGGLDAWVYGWTLIFTIGAVWLARRVQRGPLGRAWGAARDHPLAAQSIGISITRVRALAFATAAALAAVSGALQTWASGFLAPDSFPVFLSISLLVGLVIGGVRSLGGTLIGAVFIQVLPTFLADLSTAAPWAVYGVLMILSGWLMPEGVAGRIHDVRRRVQRSSSWGNHVGDPTNER